MVGDHRCRVRRGVPFLSAAAAFWPVLVVLMLAACVSKPAVGPYGGPATPPVVSAPTVPDPAAVRQENRLINQARDAEQGRDNFAARQIYAHYLDQFPEGAYRDEALTQLGLLLARADRHDDARQYLEQVDVAFPQSPWHDTAVMQLMLLDEAAGLSEAVVARGDRLLNSPTLTSAQRSQVYFWLAAVRFNLEDASGGLQAALNGYTIIDPATRPAHAEEMAELVDRADIGTHTTAIENLAPGSVRAFLIYRLALRYLAVGEQALAVASFNQVMDEAPQSPEADAAREQIARLEGQLATKQVAVGCLLPLSGPYQAFGQKALAGIEYALLALDRSELGRRIEIQLVVQDTAGDAAYAPGAVQALERAGVVAALGAMVTAEKVSREMAYAQIPLIALTHHEGIPQTSPFIFRNFITPQHQVEALVEHAMGGLGLTRFAILYPEEAYGEHHAELFWEAVKTRAGAIVGAYGYPPGTTDFRETMVRLVGKEHIKKALSRDRDNEAEAEEAETPLAFEAIFIPDAAETAALVLPQLAYYDIQDIHALGTHLWHSSKLIEMAGKYARASVFPGAFFPEGSSTAVQRFSAGFEQEFKRPPGFMEAIAYDSASMIINAIANAAEPTPAAVRDSLQYQNVFEGVTGWTWFDENGEAEKTLPLLTIGKGRFVELVPLGPRPAGQQGSESVGQ